MNSQTTLKFLKIFLAQPIILLGVSLFFLYLNSWLGFKSAFLGGLTWLIPSFYFMTRLEKIKKTFSVRKMLTKFLINEMLKLLSSFSLIVLTLLFFNIMPVPFLSGYGVMIIVSFVVHFIFGKARV